MTLAVAPKNARFGENKAACCIPSIVYVTLNLAVYAPSFCTPIVKLQRGTVVEVNETIDGTVTSIPKKSPTVPTVSHLDPVNRLAHLNF